MFYYFVLFVVLLAIETGYVYAARKWRIVDIPHHQSSHRGAVVRGGGIIFYIGFLMFSALHEFSYPWALAGLTILASISFLDDVRDIKPSIRLVCQFLAIVLMFYQSVLLNQALYVIVLLSIACVGTVNIYNFMDGINGMTGGYSLVVALALLYVNLYHTHFIGTELLILVVMSILVFCLFNFRTRAKCFAGDVGSLTIGFILVFCVLKLCLKGQSMSWVAMLAVYMVDGGMTILHRILLRENLMKPHKKHVYQIMANELKMPHLVVSWIYMGLQAACCVVYIMWPGYPVFFAIFGSLTAMYLVFMKKYYHLHVENR